MTAKQSVTTRNGDRIAIVAGLRTPFAKMATYFHGVPAVDLGKMVVNELLIRNGVSPELVDQVVYGQVVQMPEAPNIAREIVLGTGMNVHTDAYSVSRACATSFQSTVNIAESMMAGTVEVGMPVVPIQHLYRQLVCRKNLPVHWWICKKQRQSVRSGPLLKSWD